MANDFLRNLMDDDRLQAVVEAMSAQDFPAGSLIIREGESGSHLFVSANGQFEVLKGGQVVKTFGPGEAFGELAILYKAKRFASIRCKYHTITYKITIYDEQIISIVILSYYRYFRVCHLTCVLSRKG